MRRVLVSERFQRGITSPSVKKNCLFPESACEGFFLKIICGIRLIYHLHDLDHLHHLYLINLFCLSFFSPSLSLSVSLSFFLHP